MARFTKFMPLVFLFSTALFADCPVYQMDFWGEHVCFHSAQPIVPTKPDLDSWKLIKRILVNGALARSWRMANSHYDLSGIRNEDGSEQSNLTFGTRFPLFFFLPEFYVMIENLGYRHADQMHREVRFLRTGIEFVQNAYLRDSNRQLRSFFQMQCKLLEPNSTFSRRRLICAMTLRTHHSEYPDHPYNGTLIGFEEFGPTS